jgi:PAS domain S-box-containing protein
MDVEHSSGVPGTSPADVLRGAKSLVAAGPSLLPVLVGRDFAFTTLWVADRACGVLRCGAVWPDHPRLDPFRRAAKEAVFAPGVGLPGRVWLHREPAGVPALADDPNFPLGPEAAAAGLISGVAVPVLVDGRVVAVVEGFRHEAAVPAAALKERLLTAVGAVSALMASVALPAGRTARSGVMDERVRAARLEGAVELGRRALSGAAPEQLAAEAVELAATALNAELTVFLEQRERGEHLVVRAGVGWGPGVVGSVVPGGHRSLAGYTLIADSTVVVEDLGVERRFAPESALLGHGVVSAISAAVRGPTGPLGAISALTPHRRRFEGGDVAFLRLLANTLAAAIAHARAGEAVRRSDALLRAIVEGTTDAVFVKDLAGRYVMINAAGARVLGLPAAAVVGLQAHDVFPPDVAREVEASDAAVIAGGEWRTFEEPIVTGSGEARVYLSTKGPRLAADGSPIGLIGIARDITERKRAEDRQRLVAEAGRVLASGPDEETAVREVAALAVPAMADWCVIELRDADGRIVPAAAAHGGNKTRLLEELRRRYLGTPDASRDLARIVRTARPELYQHLDMPAGLDTRDAPHLELLRSVGFESAAVLPLLSRGEWLGAMTLAVTRRRRYSWDDLNVFEQLADRLALALDNARLHGDQRRLVGVLQRSVLPLELPSVPGLELAARFHAGDGAYELGGVFYDALPRAGGVVLVMCDVRGRGPEVATVLSRVGRAIRIAAVQDTAPGEMLRTVNEALLDQPLAEPYCTVALARVEPAGEDAGVVVGCAGHCPPLIRRADGSVTEVEATGRPLGVASDGEFRVAELRLRPADTLVLVSDTVVRDRRGGETLKARLAEGLDAGAQELARRIEAHAVEGQLDRADSQLAILVARVTKSTG